MLPDSISECPHCASKDIVLYGVFARTFRQPMANGGPVKEDLELGQHAMQEVEAVECKGCGIHTAIEDDEVFEREATIFDLTTQIATLQGRVTVPTSGKEWKH